MNMSLGRLLAAGKSLIGIRGGESRYRENKHVRLPKFISPKNPFISAGTPGASLESVNNPGTAAPDVPKAAAVSAARPAAAAPLLFLAPMPQAESKLSERNQSKPADTARTGWLTGFGQKVNPFGASRARKKSTGGIGPVSGRQAELALDHVQVVRSDLSDLKSDNGAASTRLTLPPLPGVATTMEKLEPVSAVWHRITDKFLGPHQS